VALNCGLIEGQLKVTAAVKPAKKYVINLHLNLIKIANDREGGGYKSGVEMGHKSGAQTRGGGLRRPRGSEVNCLAGE